MIFLVSIPKDKLRYEIRCFGLQRDTCMRSNKVKKTGYCEWQLGAAFFYPGVIPSVPFESTGALRDKLRGPAVSEYEDGGAPAACILL